MNKPSVLYHASTNKNVEIFEPHNKSIRDIDEGPVVFATPRIDYASCFIVKTDDSWVQISAYGDIQTIVISDRDRFEKEDKGGAIYELPSDTFVNEIRGSAKDEWTSREAVRPVGKNVFASGLDAMLEYGVQVYFVDASTWDSMKNAKDNGIGVLRRLKSENQVHNINVQQLPKGDFSE